MSELFCFTGFPVFLILYRGEGMGGRLKKYRKRVNMIDRRLAKLLARRYKEVLHIGNLKRGEQRDVVDRERENEVLQRVLQVAEDEGQREYIRSIYRVIFEESSDIQRGGS
jgi:chorismate mutase